VIAENRRPSNKELERTRSAQKTDYRGPRRSIQCSAGSGWGRTTARIARSAALAVWATLFTACDPGYHAVGTLVDPAGASAGTCRVKLHRVGKDEKYGLPCRQLNDRSSDPEKWVVAIGQQFQCSGWAGEGTLDLTASCDGYDYRGNPFEWRASGLLSQDIGNVFLHRTKTASSPGHN
jgi:hypothetical protein